MSNTLEYEVIAEYPSMMHELGDRITVYQSSHVAYISEIDERSEKYDLRDFPDLFRIATPNPNGVRAPLRRYENE